MGKKLIAFGNHSCLGFFKSGKSTQVEQPTIMPDLGLILPLVPHHPSYTSTRIAQCPSEILFVLLGSRQPQMVGIDTVFGAGMAVIYFVARRNLSKPKLIGQPMDPNPARPKADLGVSTTITPASPEPAIASLVNL